MAKFVLQLPDSLIDDMQKIYDNCGEIFGEMTRAGADVVYDNLKSNIPESFRGSNIMRCLKITRTYETPTDGGINTKVGFYGYFVNHLGRTVPAPLVANVFEYGSSTVTKRPFLRKSFRKAQIEKAMLEAQKRASGGLLTNE